MPQNVRPYLLTILSRAISIGATEVRFAAGQLPTFVLGVELRSAHEATVRGEMIQALHDQCLREANRSDPRQESVATYDFSLPELGQFHCEFQRFEAAPLLRIRPEAAEGVASPIQARQGPWSTNSEREHGGSA